MTQHDSNSGIPSPQPRPCPVCGATQIKLLHRQDFTGLSSGSLLSSYDVVACEKCGFVFADRIPSQEYFDKYYREMSKYEHHHCGGLEPEWVLDRYRVTAEILKPFIPSTQSRILDIGCASGGFLGLLKKQGYLQVLGFDPSPACAEAALRLHDVKVIPRTLAGLRGEQGLFDVIILAGVLEHVRDLQLAITDIRKILAPGGVLYVEVPDATAFAGRRNAPFQEFSIEHINFFSPQSLANLMCGHGMRMEQCIKQDRELSRDAIEPCLLAVFRVTPQKIAIAFDSETGPAIEQYARDSDRTDQRVRQIIADIAKERTPLVVWGVGTHTLRLLATSELANAKIAAFIDSNANYSGKTINGIPIITPEQLKNRPEAVLISSWVYQREIEAQIRNVLKLPNRITTLYDL